MNPQSRLMKINKSTKEYVKDQYADYNRYADPHLRNYMVRKKLIVESGKANLQRGLYYANREASTGVPAQFSRRVGAAKLRPGKRNVNKYEDINSRYLLPKPKQKQYARQRPEYDLQDEDEHYYNRRDRLTRSIEVEVDDRSIMSDKFRNQNNRVYPEMLMRPQSELRMPGMLSDSPGNYDSSNYRINSSPS